jgi:hypothetical protein
MRAQKFVAATFGVLVPLLVIAGEDAANTQPTITLQRFGCYGTCPIYTVSIDAQGNVHFVGEKFVEFTGEHDSSISTERYARLARAAQVLTTLKDDYSPEHGCKRYVTDAPSVTVSLQSAGLDKHVRVYLGCDDDTVGAEIAKLGEVVELIDETANTKQWIGDPSRRADAHW